MGEKSEISQKLEELYNKRENATYGILNFLDALEIRPAMVTIPAEEMIGSDEINVFVGKSMGLI